MTRATSRATRDERRGRSSPRLTDLETDRCGRSPSLTVTDSDRRRLLAAAATGLTGLLAGCAGQTTGEPTADTAASTERSTATQAATERPATAEAETPTATPSPTESPTPTPTSTPTPTTAVVVDSLGVSAWEVVDGPVAPPGERNPTLSLVVGRRYAVENRGWNAHPFALLDADGAALCSQDGDGRLEAAPGVDWTDEGDRFAFTVTETLASAVDAYVCTVHGTMRGDVTTATGGSTATGSPTPSPTDGGGSPY